VSKMKDVLQTIKVILALVAWLKENKDLLSNLKQELEKVVTVLKQAGDAVLDVAEEITKITPTDKDDEFIAKLREKTGIEDD